MERAQSPFLENLGRIRKALSDGGAFDALLITSPQNRFFATGFEATDGMALVTLDAAYFMTDFRYFEAAGRAIDGYELLMTDRGHGYLSIVGGLLSRHGVKRLGFEDGAMSCAEYRRVADALRVELLPAQKLFTGLRGIKLPFELDRLRAAQRIAERSFDELLPDIRPGITESALMARLSYLMLKNGSERNSFDPIVVSGPNGSLCHGVPGERKLADGDFVTLDFGCVRGGYCSDMTRTVALGRVTDEMRRVYETVLSAQRAAIGAAAPGIIGRDLDRVARDVIERAGYGEYFGHGLGHGVGIEVHDTPGASPSNPNPLPAGTVVTVEPGIYLPGRFGVRIEDVVILTGDGCEDITKTPKELIIL